MTRRSTSPYIIVKESSIHNKGVFARVDIPQGTRVIEYVGQKITKAEANRRSDIPLERHERDKRYGAVYIFELNKRYDIDGNVFYNTARFINHSCDPNCEAENIRGHIWIISIRDIKKDEEITYNYGYDYEDYEDHRCFCQTDKCVGYIVDEDHWPKLKRDLSKKTQTNAKTQPQ